MKLKLNKKFQCTLSTSWARVDGKVGKGGKGSGGGFGKFMRHNIIFSVLSRNRQKHLKA